MTQSTKFLIAGLGSVGRRHMRNLIALGEKDLILLRTRKTTLPEDELAPFPQETDLQEALKTHKPDAVIVANPTAMHLEVAIPAAEAGCAILLEKPISHSIHGVEQLQAAAQKSGAQILVAFQFRYHPGLARAQQLVADGEIGRVISAHVHFGEYLPAWHPWEDYRQGYAARADLGGGVVLTQCHALDYLPWLVGEKVEQVWGFIGKVSDLEIDVDDTAKIGLRFECGALGSLHLDYNRQPPVHTLDVVGTQSSIKWDLADGVTHIYRAEAKEWQAYPMPEGWERNLMFLEQMKHFVAVVRGETQPSCTLEDGIRVQKLVQAVRESDASGSAIRF